MNFYKKYETLNDIPEPFRRNHRDEEHAFQSESVKEAEQSPKTEQEKVCNDQSHDQQNTKINKGNQDMIFMLLMFMLLTE